MPASTGALAEPFAVILNPKFAGALPLSLRFLEGQG
jgi:hypothetical protein